MSGTTDSSTRLPGFGLPLNFTPGSQENDNSSTVFPNALDTSDIAAGNIQIFFTTLRELTMLQLMNEITDKPDWHVKVFDDKIVSKWKAEIQDEARNGKDITEAMVEYCISELQYKAKVFQDSGVVRVFNGDVVKSDIAIPATLRDELLSAAAILEDVPERWKDWHPGSDQQVLDLVHPSLFPLVYGRTRILPHGTTTLSDCIGRSGEGTAVPIPSEAEMIISDQYSRHHWNYGTDLEAVYSKPYSRKFQWLPCDIDISGQNGNVKIKSYINNLHPCKHGVLYTVLEKIIDRTIPLWNATLTSLKNINEVTVRVPFNSVNYDPDPEAGPEDDGPQQFEDEDYGDFWHRREEWFAATRKIVLPRPIEFKEPEPFTEIVDLKRDYGEHGLQVIVKLANIQLTPEHPSYPGGSWHVEGQLNEHICASAVYYYDSFNVTPTSLAFRQQVDNLLDDMNYGQYHHDWIEKVFGCRNEEAAIQDVGSVNTKEGRLLTWPNILQHQVQPFELADPTKPGHRKILALFLVDPNIRVISTANVPCQQKDWWAEVILRDYANPFRKLPVEVLDQIFAFVDDFPLGLKEAKELRVELMDERKAFTAWHGELFEQSVFSLCEH